MSPSEGRVAHWLPANEANRFPRRLVTFDTESRSDVNSRRERHRFRLAVACADLIDRETLVPSKTEWLETTEPLELWQFVDKWTRSNSRTVVFAHNLGFDLRVAAALTILPELGWDLRQLSIDSYRCWARWARGSRSIAMVDTMSYYPASLATIARTMGMSKRKLPDQAADDAAWFLRCGRDVEITRAAAIRLLHWLESNDLGSFRLTGPAQAEACYRHRFMPRGQLLVHDHTPALEAERRSAYTGRAEALRHGRQPGYLYEWDYRLAYAHLVKRMALPTRLAGVKYDVEPEELPRLLEHYAVLAEVDVETEAPTVPTVHEDRILWPVGRFTSTLWDRELRLLEVEGGSWSAKRVWLYDRKPALRRWAEWIIGELDGEATMSDELQRIMLKGWSRSLIGRFGLRYPTMTLVAEAPHADVAHLPYYDDETGELRYTLQIGRQVFEQQGASEGRNSMPAVMSYVMSAGRVQLWGMMRAAGIEHVAYVDTDSMLVDQAGHDRLTERLGAGRADGLRFKRRLRGVEIFAPRVLVAGNETKVAGLSKRNTRTGKTSWQAEYWESAKGAIARRRPNEVIVELRHFHVRPKDLRRRHLPHGRTGPYHLQTWEPTP